MDTVMDFLSQYWMIAVAVFCAIIGMILLIVCVSNSNKQSVSNEQKSKEDSKADVKTDEKVNTKENGEKTADEKVATDKKQDDKQDVQDTKVEDKKEDKTEPTVDSKKVVDNSTKTNNVQEDKQQPKKDEPKQKESVKAQSVDSKEVTEDTPDENVALEPTVEYVVSYDEDTRYWSVKKVGGGRALRKVFTKEEALQIAKDLCDKNNGKVTVYNKNGDTAK
jgi:cell division protein FtsN